MSGLTEDTKMDTLNETEPSTSLMPMKNVSSLLKNSSTQISSPISKTSRKERVEAVVDVFILRRTEDAQRKQVDPKIAVGRAESYEKHLTNLGIQSCDYNKVYEMAVLAHNEQEVKGPFGIDEIIQGAIRFKNLKTPIQKFSKEFKNIVACATCSGTGLKFENGKIVFGQNKKAEECEDCK